MEFHGNEDIMLRIGQRNVLSKAFSPSMTTDNIRQYCKKMKKEVSGSPDSGIIFIWHCDGNVESFEGVSRLLSDKTTTVLMLTALVAYLVHLISLSIPAGRNLRTIGNGQKLTGLLLMFLVTNNRKDIGTMRLKTVRVRNGILDNGVSRK